MRAHLSLTTTYVRKYVGVELSTVRRVCIDPVLYVMLVLNAQLYYYVVVRTVMHANTYIILSFVPYVVACVHT